MSSTSQTPGGAGQWDADRDTAKSALDRETEAARSAAGRASSTIRDEASNLASDAKKKAYESAEQGKSAAASSLEDFTAAIRKASEELGNRDQSMAANLVREAAAGLEHASGALKGQSVQELTRSVAGFARRQPAAFLIGAALAGVALGRFARASGEHGGSGSAGSDYRTDDFGASRGSGGYDPQRSSYGPSGSRAGSASEPQFGWDEGRPGERDTSSGATTPLATPAIVTEGGRSAGSEASSTSGRTVVPGSTIGGAASSHSSWDSSGNARPAASEPGSSYTSPDTSFTSTKDSDNGH